MKRATAAVRALLIRAAATTGPEGGFLIVGTALMAIGASYVSPAGPWFVVGAVCLLIAFALVLASSTPASPRKP